MNIPLVDLKTQYKGIKEEVLREISEVLDGMNLFLGENVQALEKEFAQFCGASWAVGVGSGTDAIHLALRACGVAPGDEVVTVSHTFVATVEAIRMAEARPVFVDIEPETFTIDVSKIEAAITPRTRAIVPVHIYGHPAAMSTIVEIAKRHELKVIEDACQAHGAEFEGKRAGTLGDAAAFSFYTTKNLGAYGEGGIVVTNDEDLANKIRIARDHGSLEKYRHIAMGFNARLDEIQAAILRVKLPHLDGWNSSRRVNAAAYDRLLDDSSVQKPIEQPGYRHVYHLYVVRTDRRDALQEWLRSRGVATGIHYPIPVHEQIAYQDFRPTGHGLDVTERHARTILSLPMYPEMTPDQIEYVAERVNEFFAGASVEREREGALAS